ncbi:complement C1r subcomponent-like protein isoform X3 [Sapajus apella]|uniref:Complement C1r subcomponent-like protein isoform X3 n=1 Tax=Sapajus apella TaxID=9515 RepID=A0A6J3FZ17_SAPAP|nr:complement C1r subcomponent-like protein isoform X3 [Sapajus apella]
MPAPRVRGDCRWRSPHSAGCAGAMLPAAPARPHLALPHSQVVAAPLGSPPGLPHPGLRPLGPAATPAADFSWVPRAVSQRPREHHGHPGSRGLCCEARLPGLRPGAVPGLCRGLCHTVNCSQPISQASRSSEAISTPGDSPAKVQNHCQEPYYQATAAGALSCTTPGTWKDTQDGEEVPQCVPVCGRPVTPIDQNQTTLGSSRAKLGNFPWQAFTSIHGRGGGALLGDRWILTAAHTIYPKDSVSPRKNRSVNVFLGHTSIDEMLKLGNHPVHRVIVHPDYHHNESHSFNGDIALLELQHSVPLGPNVLPVCLPDNETLYHSGLLGYVSGFGMEMGWLTTELKYSRLPVAPREACKAWLQKRQRPEVFSDSMFCVGDEMQRHSVCQGDSGSVYVVWDDRAHHWVATGIVSWGIGCGSGYDFYTKVLSYVDWIKGVMNGKN